jgi:hypothetical protein
MKNLHSTIHELFCYESSTGDILQKKKRSKIQVGKLAGTLRPTGYRYIEIQGKKYPAHHLVWFFETGSFPKFSLDHIDSNRSNNHFSNLREVTTKQNCEHRGKQKNNSTGYKGVTFNKRLNKFIAQIQHNYKSIHIGVFETAIEASLAYEKTAKSLFTHY